MTSTRNRYIDALKGYAIFMVVVGHALQRTEFRGLLAWPPLSSFLPYSGYVTMPLFFAISGYLTFGHVHTPRGQWLLRKARMLLVPTVAWTIVYYFLVNDGLIPTQMPFFDYLHSQLIATSLWFPLVLFYCYVLMTFASLLGEWAMPLLVVVLALVFERWLHPLDWYWAWFSAGYFYCKYHERLARLKWPAWGVAAVVYVTGISIPVISAEFWPRLVFALAFIGVSTLAVYAIRRIQVFEWLGYLGRRSMSVYLGQFLFVQLVIAHSWKNAVVTTVLAIAGSLLIDRVLALNPWTNALFLGGRGIRPATTPRLGEASA